MVRIRKASRWAGALALTAASFAAGEAAADTTPVVRIVPTGPIVLRTPDTGATARRPKVPTAYLDRSLPAGEAFDMELPLPGKSTVYASLEIWPLAEQPSPRRGEAPVCAASPPGDARQHYRLGMRTSGADKERVFVAKVPPLQVGQKYCFKVNVSAGLEANEMADVAKSAASALAQKPVIGAKPCFDSKSDAPAFEEALAEALRRRGPWIVDSGEPARAALLRFETDGKGKCAAVLKEKEKEQANGDESKKKAAQVDQRKAAIGDLPLLAQTSSPLVRSGDDIVLARSLLSEDTAPTKLRVAAEDLRLRAGRAGAPPAVRSALDRWASVLSGLARAFDGATPAARKKALAEAIRTSGAIPSIQQVEIWNGHDFEALDAFRKHPEVLGASLVVAQIKTIAAGLPRAAKQDRETADRWMTAFNDLGFARAQLDAANEKRRGAAASAQKTEQDLEKALEEALGHDDVRNALLVQFDVLTDDKAGHGETPDAANFAALDAGLAVALPSGGSKVDPWILPYLGFNIYATAVDRKIPLEDLTGGSWQRFRQRVSLTFGVTLNQPSLVGREVRPILFERYPLVAIGVRVTHYMRLTGGTVFYKLVDENPASAGESIRLAPFVGLSADVDLLHIFGLTPKL